MDERDEATNRALLAVELADVLRDADVTDPWVGAGLPATAWTLADQVVRLRRQIRGEPTGLKNGEVHTPSEETRAVVISLLRQPPDPFAGFPKEGQP